MKKLLRLARLLAHPRKLLTLLSFTERGYLLEIGWFNAAARREPVDARNIPIPWVTYSFIDFICGRVNDKLDIFEFGCGSSTLFYAHRARCVDSVEHDRGWFDEISAKCPDNVSLHFCALEPDGNYCRLPLGLGKRFHVIIVDGRDRVNCCKQAIHALSPDGVIVLDDSERENYGEGIKFLQKEGFRHLSFSGISPGLFYRKSTSVFYKPNNCLGI